MNLNFIVTCWILLAISLVSGDIADTISLYDGTIKFENLRPTEAPLQKSTLKPTVAPFKVSAPTKPMVMETSAITHGKIQQPSGQIVESIGYSKDQTNIKPEKPDVKKSDAQGPQLVTDEKPAKVIGFITQNGDIYEIENKDGIGLIEGRQSTGDEKTIVCNYGSIVIYSDVPCKEVTGVRIGNVIETTAKGENDQEMNTQNQNENQNQQQEGEHNQQSSAYELEVLEAVKPFRRRNGQKRKRFQQNNINLRRTKNKNKNRNRNQSPENLNQVRRRRVQTQRRRKNQQNQRFPTQRRQSNNRNQAQRPYRRFQNLNNNHKRRLNGRLQQESLVQ